MIYNIARAELQLLFYSPVAWLILVAFAVQATLIFSSRLEGLVSAQEMGYTIAGATYRLFSHSGSGMLSLMQEYLYFYIPLLTMGIVSREMSSGSIKLLYSSPVTNVQIILGKYFGVMLFGLILVSVLIVLGICGVCTVERFDWSTVLTGILGLYLLLCTYAAIGIFMSSLTGYQVVAAISTLIVLMLLSIVGRWGQDYAFVRDVTYWLSINGRCDTFIRGMLCSEDILYFLIVIALFLSLTIIRLNAVRQKIPFSKTLVRNVCVILGSCLLGYFSSLPALKAYHDATATKMNTLTPNSQEVLAKLTGKVTITTYINVLEDGGTWYAAGHFVKGDQERFEKYLRFKPSIKFNYVRYYDTVYNPRLDKRYPGATLHEKMIEECRAYELDTNHFLTPSQIRERVDLSSENNTFVRLIERENGEKAWLRIYDDMQRFPGEREITAAFKRVVMQLPAVGFVVGHGERDYKHDKDADFSAFVSDKKSRYALVNQGFDVEAVVLDKPVRNDIRILVIAESKTSFTEAEIDVLRQYINRGDNIFILGEPRRRKVMNPLFAEFGFEMMDGQLVMRNRNLQADVIISRPTPEAAGIAYDFGDMLRRRQVVASQGVTGLRQIADLGYTVTELFKSDTVGSWNELETTDFVDDTIRLNPAIGEVEQSYPTMVALSRQVNGKEQRVILSGDADCISNGELLGSRRGIRASNFSVITGGFFWLSDNEVPIDVRRPPMPDNKLYIGSTGASVLWWMLVVILPVALVATAIVLGVRRKGR